MPASWLCYAVPQGPTSLLSLLGAVPPVMQKDLHPLLSKQAEPFQATLGSQGLR